MATRRRAKAPETRDQHEQRFVALLAFAAPEAAWSQEVSLPRKARRLDIVIRFDEAPTWFGALRDVCHRRVVLLEHVSRAARLDDVAGAWLGLSWLMWRRVQPSASAGAELWGNVEDGLRPPLAMVVADGVHGDLAGAVPSLRRGPAAGLWATQTLDEGGIVVVDTRSVRASDGLAWWSWVGGAHTDAEAAARLERLIDDPSIPIVERERLKEAAMQKKIPVSPSEEETVYQRLKREASERHVAGHHEGLKKGRQEGRRDALLRLAARIAIDDIDTLRSIDDLDALEDAIAARMTRATQG